ncbi:hypothetical protein RB653_004512 [Dictyostelium firmibasis]|uniref:Cytochrome b5 heme-binding domain-containing protein n=1 Tax=Dictyostelium firmibasis TaxID=79012 RepID=A0AAN7U682_9MYCE
MYGLPKNVNNHNSGVGLPPPVISEMIIKLSNRAMEKYSGIIGKTYSIEEVSKHNKKDDCWIIVNNKVYDMTEYLLYHPGGPNLLFKCAGKDATDDFEGMFHSRNAKAILERFYIGKASSSSSILLTPNYKPPPSFSSSKQFLVPTTTTLSTTTTTLSTTTTAAAISLSKNKKIILSKVKIDKKIKSTENTYHYFIEIPEEHRDLEWISPLSHVSLAKCIDNNNNNNNNNEDFDNCSFKSYTPIKQTKDKKYLEFLIKGYEHGDVSKHIHQLKEGDHILLKGPIETADNFDFEKQQNYLLMIAGGTGITPMIQIILESFYGDNNSNNNSLKFILIYSSNNENEIIYKNELDEISKQFKDRLFIHYVITKPCNSIVDKSFKKGRINQDMILTCLEPIIIKLIPKMVTDSMEILVCGPIDFNKSISKELSKIGFKDNQIHILQ